MKETNKIFESEIKLLDLIYSDMIDALHNKPSSEDIEAMRLYIDNLWGVFNRSVLRITEVKNSLSKGLKPDTNTWNPPA